RSTAGSTAPCTRTRCPEASSSSSSATLSVRIGTALATGAVAVTWIGNNGAGLSAAPQRAAFVVSPPLLQPSRGQVVAPGHQRYRLATRQRLFDHLALERQRIASPTSTFPCSVHFAPPWTLSACPSKPKRVSLIGMDTPR